MQRYTRYAEVPSPLTCVYGYMAYGVRAVYMCGCVVFVCMSLEHEAIHLSTPIHSKC